MIAQQSIPAEDYRGFVYINHTQSDSNKLRVNSETESLLLGFTVFTQTESDRLMYSAKLEDTSVYHAILEEITNRIPNIASVFIASIVNECEVGAKPITIAGKHKCQSICGLNQVNTVSF